MGQLGSVPSFVSAKVGLHRATIRRHRFLADRECNRDEGDCRGNDAAAGC